MRLSFIVLILVARIAFSQSPSGIIWEDQKYLALPLKTDFGVSKVIPAKFSLKAFSPRVVNQISFATSAGWASVWYGQTIAQAASCIESDANKITTNAFSPLYAYQSVNTQSGCDEPVSLIDVLEYQLTNGSPRFSEFGDLCPVKIPENIINQTEKNKIDGFVKLYNPFDTEVLKTQAIKKALYNSHPVIIGMIVPPSFSLADEFWQAREQPDTAYAAQALCVVGFDDQKFGGAFEVVNQWGDSWGQNGFTWIRYTDMAHFARYGFELINSASCFTFPESSVVLFNENGKVIDQIDINNKFHNVKRPLKIGTKFRMSIRASSGIFIYFLFKDKEVTTLFPNQKTHSYVSQNITLPSTEAYYRLEGIPQTNELYIIASRRQLDPVWLQSQLQNQTLLSLDEESTTVQVDNMMKDILRVAIIQLEQY
ncbi:MAG: C1 family peptidase [Cyclobacteriaceae bacterium]|nr:C1 family peptidase [Cyclobacteriaceae bacterium]